MSDPIMNAAIAMIIAPRDPGEHRLIVGKEPAERGRGQVEEHKDCAEAGDEQRGIAGDAEQMFTAARFKLRRIETRDQ